MGGAEPGRRRRARVGPAARRAPGGGLGRQSGQRPGGAGPAQRPDDAWTATATTAPDKTNTYRSLVDMAPLPAGQSPAAYCSDIEQIQGSRLQQDVNLLIERPKPAAGRGDNLFTFLAMRLQQSFMNLDCGSFGRDQRRVHHRDGNGVAVAACFANQVAAVTPGRATRWRARRPARRPRAARVRATGGQRARQRAAVCVPTTTSGARRRYHGMQAAAELWRHTPRNVTARARLRRRRTAEDVSQCRAQAPVARPRRGPWPAAGGRLPGPYGTHDNQCRLVPLP